MSASVEAMTQQTPRAPRYRGSSLLWGATPEFATEALHTMVRVQREFGDVVRTRFGPIPIIMVSKPADIQRVLVDNRQNYTKRTYPYQILKLLLGNGLVTSEGAFWLKQRRIVQPSFHRDRMAQFSTMITDVATDMTRTWEGAAQRRETRDILTDMTLITLRVAGFALLSEDLGKDADGVGEALTGAQRYVDHRLNYVLSPPLWVPTRRNRQFKQARALLFGLVGRVLEQRRAAGGGGKDLLGTLLEAKDPETGETMTQPQLLDELVTILMAGHETTSNALAWTLYRLSMHPDVARRVRQELHEVLADRPPALEDLRKLVYLDAVLKESMRLHPPVWIMDRYAEADDVLGGYAVPKGTTVITSPYVTHRHPGYWSNPEGFDPDRWFTPEVKKLPKLAYFPFSVGQRKCVGDTLALLEAPLILATLLQKFAPELEQGHPVVPETLVTLRPKFGMRMAIKAAPAVEAHRQADPAGDSQAEAAGCPVHPH